MEEKLRNIQEQALGEIKSAQDEKALDALRIKYLGRNGIITNILGSIPTLPVDERPQAGKNVNEIKQRLIEAIKERTSSLSRSTQEAHKIDPTMPGILKELGHKHPITQVTQEVCDIFFRLGFQIAEGPEIETDYYNFEALNIAKDHPSRDTFDTFYLDKDILLRSQTSTVQVRVMEKRKPPLRIIAPGKVYRPDATDASHSFMFHQLEGFMVDKEVSFAELKGVLSIFVTQLFGPKTKMRFRPHFFPFTEPSAEIDISCIICGGQGCRVCSQKGWLEILGAGMINPAVFKAVGYKHGEYTGFAFGMGIDRIAMLKYGIDDIRLLYENDVRFLRQF